MCLSDLFRSLRLLIARNRKSNHRQGDCLSGCRRDFMIIAKLLLLHF